MQSNKITMTAAVIFAATLFAAALAHTGQAFADDNNCLIVPMYGWDAGWSEIIYAKEEDKGIEIIAAINPSSGPGAGKDSYWAGVADDLQDAGIKVVSYISTAYAGRGGGDVKNEIDYYYDWYDLDGAFLDEVSPSANDYYEELGGYAESPDGYQKLILSSGARFQNPMGILPTSSWPMRTLASPRLSTLMAQKKVNLRRFYMASSHMKKSSSN